MSIQVKVTSNLGTFLNALDTQIEAALVDIGQQCEGHAKQEIENSPKRIDTGLLRNSITYAVDGQPPATKSYKGDNPPRANPKGPIPEGSYSGSAPKAKKDQRCVYVGTNVEYAIYVHDGHLSPNGKLIPGNKFIKNAVTNNSGEYEAIAKEHLEG